MKAEDTVLWAKEPQILPRIAEKQNELLYKQAKVSFEAGVKQVVEWLKGRYSENYLQSFRSIKCYYISEELLQAQLKDWGIK